MIDLQKLNAKFKRSGDILAEDLEDFALANQSHTDENGVTYYTLAKQTVRWLLHNLNHEELCERKAKSVMAVKKRYEREKDGFNWGNSSIVIDKSDCFLEEGVVRLYAIALMRVDDPAWSVTLPIKFKNGEQV